MSELKKHIEQLDLKFTKLALKNRELHEEKIQLQKENSHLKESLEKLHQQLEVLQKENSSLKSANALLGSESYKRETKLKINSIIREIDHCVAQLSRE